MEKKTKNNQQPLDIEWVYDGNIFRGIQWELTMAHIRSGRYLAVACETTVGCLVGFNCNWEFDALVPI